MKRHSLALMVAIGFTVMIGLVLDSIIIGLIVAVFAVPIALAWSRDTKRYRR